MRSFVRLQFFWNDTAVKETHALDRDYDGPRGCKEYEVGELVELANYVMQETYDRYLLERSRLCLHVQPQKQGQRSHHQSEE